MATSSGNKNQPMKGVLFKAKNKTKSTQPDFTGSCNIDGKEYRLAAWENKTSDGKVYYSISFSEPNTNGGNQSGKSSSSDDVTVDDILNL